MPLKTKLLWIFSLVTLHGVVFVFFLVNIAWHRICFLLFSLHGVAIRVIVSVPVPVASVVRSVVWTVLTSYLLLSVDLFRVVCY